MTTERSNPHPLSHLVRVEPPASTINISDHEKIITMHPNALVETGVQKIFARPNIDFKNAKTIVRFRDAFSLEIIRARQKLENGIKS